MIAWKVSDYGNLTNSCPTIEKAEIMKITNGRVFLTKKKWEHKVTFNLYNPHCWFDNKDEAVEFFIAEIKKAEAKFKRGLERVKNNKLQFKEI